ncbi:MAG: hypothetical protein SGJ07_00070 [Rhodospirillaceae bacterium]|nr:hypothetical protein [Rhodospirillaceae bacterium]
MNDIARSIADEPWQGLDPFFAASLRRVTEAARAVVARRDWDILIIARRSEGLDETELAAGLVPPVRSITLVRDIHQLEALDRRFDVCLLCNRVTDDELLLKRVRERRLADFIAIWTWDNHHSRRRNLQIAALGDLVLPGHRFCDGYLKSPQTVLGAHVPLGTNQWSRARAASLFRQFRKAPRDDALHGGFIGWRIVPERATLVRACMEALDGHALRVLGSEGRRGYFALDPADRWRDWSQHKVGLVLPFDRDLSTRFFDSLLTGQVPILPDWCEDIDTVVPEAIQRALPVVRFSEASVPAIEAAWREALARYDEQGADGAMRRHLFALDNHHFGLRLPKIWSEIEALAAPDVEIAIEASDGGVGPVLKQRST